MSPSVRRPDSALAGRGRRAKEGTSVASERKIKLSPLVHSFILFVPSVTTAAATTSSAAAFNVEEAATVDPIN